MESYDYRTLNIKPECLQTINKISSKDKCDFSDLLSVMFLNSNLNLTKVNYTRERYSDLKYCYKKKSANEYNNVSKNIAAIFDDIVYFPVAKSTTSGKWVSYEDSFGAERNYNGSYPHEGCDIMAENNVSGYYPIVSVSDGTVENIGWLEKGGYRVGIRSSQGGYFYYAHLSSYSDIKKGDKIKAGTLLGYMGNTGYGTEGTTGCFDVHLHFGIYAKTKNYYELSYNPYCILKYSGNGKTIRERMQVMCSTNDGFVISQKDLELRGSGDFFGTMQHGIPEFKIANLFEDMPTLKAIQSIAMKIILDDPKLEKEKNRLLYNLIKDKFLKRIEI